MQISDMIETGEDARLARENGVDGIIVSNHGGRALETGRSTIEVLAEVVAAVRESIPVLMDSGVRRGTDVYKALALGARAVGRLLLWRNCMSVSRDDIEAYGRDGVICVRSLVGAELAERMRDASVELLARQQGAYADNLDKKTRMGNIATVENEPGRFFVGVFMSGESEVFRDFVMNSPLPQAAAELMGSSVARFFYDQIFVKEPGTISPTLWHHDMPFWPLTGSDLISCWVALTPVTKESSAVEYIAGSQNWDIRYRPTAAHVDDERLKPAPNFSDPANRDGHRFLSWDMRPGDVLFHHPLVVHGAGGNRSPHQRRIGLSIRYIGNDAQWAPRPKAMTLRRDPNVAPGEYPADDEAFPIAWQRTP